VGVEGRRGGCLGWFLLAEVSAAFGLTVDHG